jgi:Flp pilus assembly protein TadB
MIYGVFAGLALAVLAGAAFFISRSARHKERARAARASLDHAREANEIEEQVDGMSAGDLDRELRKHQRH